MRLALLLAPLPVLIAGACSLESGGLSADAGADSPGLEDRGIGMTDSGGTCACVRDPGAGWTFIAYERDGSDPCGGDFVTQKFAVEEANTGAPMCTCTCGMPTTPSTCAITGNINVNLYKNNNCAGTPDQTYTATSPCYDNTDYNQNAPISVKASATVTVTGGTCDPPMTTTNVPSDLHKGQACTLTAGLGAGCTSGDVCVPKAPGAFGLCVSKAMPNAPCPAGFPTQHRVGVGKSDSRSCTTCSCASDPICPAGAIFWDHNDCSNNQQGQNFELDGLCHVVTANNSINGHSIASGIINTTQRCTATGGMPTGTVSLDSEYTICCP